MLTIQCIKSTFLAIKKKEVYRIVNSIKTIEEMGYSPDFFTLEHPEPDGKLFQYYTFAGTARPELIDTWEIIGLTQSQHTSPDITLRLLHLEEEMLDWENFQALQSAGSFVRLGPSQTRILLEFFKTLVKEEQVTDREYKYFHPLDLSEMRAIHILEIVIHYWEGSVYEYHLHDEIHAHEERYILGFPRWSQQFKGNQASSLTCASFKNSQLTNINFCPLYEFRVSTISFTMHAFSEFISLLEHHSYEAFLARQK